MIKIQKRDKKILTLIYEHSFLLRAHIRRLFPNDAETRRRIIELKNNHYIREVPSPIACSGQVIRLTQHGIRFVEEYYPTRIEQIRHLSPTKHQHDSHVIHVRLRLEELWNGNWIAENLLPRAREEIPDGIFVFPSGKRIFIELENSLKSRKRFLDRLYVFKEKILVLYIASSPTLERSLKRYLKSAESLPPLALIKLSSLLDSTPAVWSPNNNLSLFHTKEF